MEATVKATMKAIKSALIFYLLFFGLTVSNIIIAKENSNDPNKTFVIGSIGDSISTAMNSNGWGNRKQNNWSTGTTRNRNLRSHFHKLQQLFQKKVEPYNFAVAGATSYDIASQVGKLLPYNPDYVTILIGANDACHWKKDYHKQLNEFKKNINNAVKRLIAHNPQVKLLLVPIPNMYHLWKTVHQKGSCQMRWNLFNVCSNLLDSDRTEKERLAFQQRIVFANDYLEEIANNHLQHIRFNRSIANHHFKWEHVSPRDCFHPSVTGQNVISQLTWEADWFNDNYLAAY